MPQPRYVLHAVFAAAALALPVAAGAQTPDVLRQGAFVGQSGHATSGSAAIVIEDGRAHVSLGRDFAFDGAPDPRVAFGPGGDRPETVIAPLGAPSGAQSYPVPAGADPAAIGTVWIWCEQYDVPLGIARLE